MPEPGQGGRQVPYRPRLEEEVGGDPHATYAYIAADAAAKEKGTEPGAEVLRALLQGQDCAAIFVVDMCGLMASRRNQAEQANIQDFALFLYILSQLVTFKSDVMLSRLLDALAIINKPQTLSAGAPAGAGAVGDRVALCAAAWGGAADAGGAAPARHRERRHASSGRRRHLPAFGRGAPLTGPILGQVKRGLGLVAWATQSDSACMMCSHLCRQVSVSSPVGRCQGLGLAKTGAFDCNAVHDAHRMCRRTTRRWAA